MILYVDTSVLVCLAFQQGPYKKYDALLTKASEIISTAFLEAELMATFKRENIPLEKALTFTKNISLIFPHRPLTPEYQEIFSLGYLRGADTYHLACALFVDPSKKELHILTADKNQATIAKKLGFSVSSF